MADNAPIRGTAYTFKLGLPSVATAGTFQSSPTLAAGDVKVSIDGGALANITTLPTASGKIVTVSLSAAEMTGDSIVVQFSDVSGNEWRDVLAEIKPQGQDGARLATTQDLNPVVRSYRHDGTDIGTSTLDAAGVWSNGTRTLTAGTNIVLAKGTGVTGFNDIAAADVWAVAIRRLSDATLSGGGTLANTANADSFKADVSGLLTKSEFDTDIATLQSHGDSTWATGAAGDATLANQEKILKVLGNP